MIPLETVSIVLLIILTVLIGYLVSRIGILRDKVQQYKISSELWSSEYDRRGRRLAQLDNERSDFKTETENNFINTISIGDEFTPIGDGPISKGGRVVWTEEFRGSKNKIVEIDYDNRKFVSTVEGHGTFDVSFDSVKDMLWLKTDSSKKIKFKFV